MAEEVFIIGSAAEDLENIAKSQRELITAFRSVAEQIKLLRQELSPALTQNRESKEKGPGPEPIP